MPTSATVRSLIPAFLRFKQLAGETPAERGRLWRELYLAPHEAELGVYSELCGEPDDLDATLARLLGDAELISAREQSVKALAPGVVSGVADLFELPELRCTYVALVGHYSADAWVVDFEGAPTAFLALESWSEPPEDEAFLVHETTHLAHAALRPAPWPTLGVGAGLMMEGLALHAVRELAPHVPEHMRLFLEEERYRALVDSTEAARPTLIPSLRKVLAADGLAEYGRFFYPDWLRSVEDVPERVGYLLGERVVELLRERRSLGALARLDHRSAERLVDAALARL